MPGKGVNPGKVTTAAGRKKNPVPSWTPGSEYGLPDGD